jgi:hypothetical protein
MYELLNTEHDSDPFSRSGASEAHFQTHRHAVQQAAHQKPLFLDQDVLKTCKFLNIVTDLINTLPGNGFLNTDCVFYVVRAEQRWNNRVMRPVSKQLLGKHTSVLAVTSSTTETVFSV